jgi:carbamoyl-phosphate synthase small subunit
LGRVKIKAFLALEDGRVMQGSGFGAPGEASGEVVFNTGMVGYTESLTDPSYRGQILLQTYPLIGNYGVPPRALADPHGVPLDFESDRVQVEGYAIARLEGLPSHWSNSTTLESWLAGEGVPGIEGIDTRCLTKVLRAKGTMLGILATGDRADPEDLASRARRMPDPNTRDLAAEAGTKEPIIYNRGGKSVIVVIDCGMKYGILRSLLSRSTCVVRVPPTMGQGEIEEFKPAGILVSNGPGDPKMCGEAIRAVRGLLEAGVPMMGICLGNQLLALAAGADTYKLPFGHRGSNQPCVDLRTRRCYITSQNHGFAVKPESLVGTGFEPSFINANDRTVEGIRHSGKPVFGVQFHPEASPGPEETAFLFDEFLKEVRK